MQQSYSNTYARKRCILYCLYCCQCALQFEVFGFVVQMLIVEVDRDSLFTYIYVLYDLFLLLSYEQSCHTL